MNMKRGPVPKWLAACVLWAALLLPAAAADPTFPLASRIGLVPPAGMALSKGFPGFGDEQNNVFVRLIALPAQAYGELEKTMTNETLKKQGMTVEKREVFTLPTGKGILVITRQEANAVRIRKWLLIAPLGDITGLISFEVPLAAAARYPDAAIRAALATIATRATVPVDEQLMLVPFRLSDLAGLRLVRVVPGIAAQFTDGPKDGFESEQAHLVISIGAGGPKQSDERDQFARIVFGELPPNLKEVRLSNSESMRIAGQQGHEARALGKNAQTGTEVEIVQWLRFGGGAYLRIVGFAPKDKWLEAFPRFRALRDGLEPR